MATGAVDRNGMGIARGACGTNTGDGTALSLTLGYRPKRVTIYNMTDATKFEVVDGMGSGNTVKTVTGGSMTVDNASAIVITDSGFVASAAVNAAGKALVWSCA